MNPIQEKIKTLVEEYQELFNDEYNAFCRSMVDKRELQMDEFASTKQDGFIHQFAYEIPFKLNEILYDSLNKEERTWFISKEGSEWFGRTFKQYCPADRI